MASFKSTQATQCLIADEAAFGTAIASGGTWNEYPVTSFTMPELSAPVEYSAPRVGRGVNYVMQGHHRPDQKVYTFDITMKGNTETFLRGCASFFEDASSVATLPANYAFPTTYVHGGSVTTQCSVLFTEVGADATSDLLLTSCVATGMSWACDIGSEGGEWTVTLNMMTAYQPTYVNYSQTNTVNTTAIKNIKDLTCTLNSGSAETLVMTSFNLDFSRTVERVHYSESSTYRPYGYAMTGVIDVTGSLTCKRDEELEDVLGTGRFSNSTVCDLQLVDSSTAGNFTLDMDRIFLNEPSIDNGGAFYQSVIPFTAVAGVNYDATVDDAVVNLTIAN
tara:strand:+ start:2688 stop:3692 length:1005 start_codon:yes stop_codon:yes gene_type:complete